MIAKQAAEIGVTSAIRYFKKKFNDQLALLKKEWKEDMTVSKLDSKKRGRPLMLEKIDKQVQMYIGTMASKGCPINTSIVMAAALGIVRSLESFVVVVDI
uniref:Uncharacterized protein n=1 Tax=Amphimedon queenslandica TaxID=400682 RepID=A0A1X7TZJ6_AMPQE